MRVLQQVATEYNWERDLLQACADRGMNRIVRAIDSGEHRLRDSDPASVVFFLIFDLAKGDIRAVHEVSLQLDLGRIFRALHDVAVGVQQLHAADFTHQDVKPSNVLTYEEERELAKLGDLGRASRQDGSIGHDLLPFAGDRGHAPPEGLYGDSPPDWSGRRACDLYHLGSLVLTCLPEPVRRPLGYSTSIRPYDLEAWVDHSKDRGRMRFHMFVMQCRKPRRSSQSSEKTMPAVPPFNASGSYASQILSFVATLVRALVTAIPTLYNGISRSLISTRTARIVLCERSRAQLDRETSGSANGNPTLAKPC